MSGPQSVAGSELPRAVGHLEGKVDGIVDTLHALSKGRAEDSGRLAKVEATIEGLRGPLEANAAASRELAAEVHGMRRDAEAQARVFAQRIEQNERAAAEHGAAIVDHGRRLTAIEEGRREEATIAGERARLRRWAWGLLTGSVVLAGGVAGAVNGWWGVLARLAP